MTTAEELVQAVDSKPGEQVTGRRAGKRLRYVGAGV